MDRPLDGKVHVVVLQRPDVLGERCTVLVLGVPKRLLMAVEPLFKGSCDESRVLLHTCVCFHGCLVYDRLGLACSFKGTELFLPTVAACSRFRGVAIGGSGGSDEPPRAGKGSQKSVFFFPFFLSGIAQESVFVEKDGRTHPTENKSRKTRHGQVNVRMALRPNAVAAKENQL